MKAVAYSKSLPISEPESLVDMELPDPTPGPQDLLVKVEAVSVNPVDTKIRVLVQPDGPKVLGWDAVGTVVSVGSQVSGYETGQRVWYAGDLQRAGSNSELHCVDARLVARAPTSLSPEQGAALPLTAITAWELLFERLGIRPGKSPTSDVLLISGAAGGVGSILIQLAARLTSATVVATAGRPESEQWVKSLGAHHVVSYREPLAPQIKALGLSVSHVASLTHTQKYFEEFAEVLKPFGKLALIDDPGPLDIGLLKTKSLSLIWEFMFTHSMYQTENMKAQSRLLQEVADLVDSGVIKTTLSEVFGVMNAQNLKRAHELIERGEARGKIVLRVETT